MIKVMRITTTIKIIMIRITTTIKTIMSEQ